MDRSARQHTTLATLLNFVSYEVIPLRRTAEAVLGRVPTTVPLTVTVTQARGIDATVDLAEHLQRHGYRVAPHLAARLFIDDSHVADVVARLAEAGVRSVFVIGGDAPRPAGALPDAYALLQSLHAMGHPFQEVGIAGHPEGHATVPQDAMDLALKQKAPLATHIMTQICFDAARTSSWAARIAAGGVGLPVHVGIPGPVNRQRLIRITAGLGLGQSARFLRAQRSLPWRLLLPGGYDPTRLAKRLATGAARTTTNIRGLHIYTFNEVARTEAWRRELLARVGEAVDRT
jgi:methylenetetrahydrofolate reductase (NADPH)